MNKKRNLVIRYTAAMCMLLGSFMYGTGCRNEPAEPLEKIASIAFDKERVNISIDEEATVRVIAKSDAAKRNETITYTSVNEGIIEIREPTNDGFIVKGLRGGTTIITAKSELVTSYFEAVVTGESILAHYITVAQPVIEMLEGERRSTQVSLYGGSVLDNNDFVWRLENGKDNISIDITENIAVISGLQRGHQKIIVSHPKADYESEILVFVTGLSETVKYISGQSNVMLAANDGQYHDFEVVLVNGETEDIVNFEHEVTEGNANIDVVRNGNVFNVKGNRSGSSVIRIKHPLAVVDFDVRVIVYDIDIPFIMLEQTFLLMNIGESANVAATVEYARNGIESNTQFSYEIMENDVVINKESSILEVIQNNNSFYIRAKRGGSARVIIENEQAQTKREILAVVRAEVVYRDDYYITTSQNVIMTQVGADAVQLNMQLVNGNNADANGFEWVVDDGTIVTVESAHGIVRGNRAAINSVFNAIAIITPKKAGTAKITVSHPKSEVTAAVMVKVYPKGTFAEPPILVGYEGLIKVKKGAPENDPDKSPRAVQLSMVSGDILNVGSLDWTVADRNIAAVNVNSHTIINVLSAVNNGLTKMTVNGVKLEYPHESLVLAGTPEFVDMASVIYVDSIYQKMVTEQTVRIEVKDSQDKYKDSNDFDAAVEDRNLLYAVMIKSQLVLQGKAVGETKVKITHKSAINDITLNVRIDPAYITIDKPYYISGPEMKGVVRGISYDGVIEKYLPITVSLAGAGESETGKMVWSIDDTGVASIIANGNSCIVTGKASNKQTKIRVSHPKAENEKIILLYVVENESDLYNKIALGLQSEHYLLTRGEERLITLITNAGDVQKLGLRWKIKGEADGVLTNGVLTVDPHYDSAMVRAIGAGNAEIVVTHDDNIVPLSIYVSVVDALSAEKVIQGPAVIELIRNESKIVSVNHNLTNAAEISNIRWSIEDASIANIQENGDSAYMLGLKKGVTFANIRQDGMGYKHRATLVCANTPEELAAMYVMGVDSSYHTMLTGDEKKIKLSFGSAGFPEAAKSAIRWAADTTGVVRVVGRGESATMVAVNEGIGKVTVESETSFNSLELTFEVRGYKAGVYELRASEKIKGMVTGTTGTITMGIWETGGDEVTSGYSLLQYENENDNIITINPVDNIINITAKNTGQSYITVRHKQVNEAARILVYTASSPDELAKYYPILVEKTNYLLQVGEQAKVRIETIAAKDNDMDDNGQTKFANVSWGPDNASVIENADFRGKKEVVIKARAEGQCVLNISYKGSVAAQIFITVVSNDAVDMTKYIMTENIIGLVKDESYPAKIFSNLGASELSTVLWESTDNNIVTVSGSGENGALRGVNNGEAYVTVSYGSWLKRHILVYVCGNKTQVDAYKAMNMENQYYRVGLNETLILPVYYAPNKTNAPTLWIDKYDNKVVRFNAYDSGGRLEITTLNEGVAVLEAANTGLSNPGGVLRVYIEVSKRYNNAPKAPEVKYLTTGKTVYVMNPDEPDAPLDLSVSGIGMTVDELAKVKWEIESGGQYVSIAPNGKDCRVMVNRLGLEGDAKLKAYYVDNIVEIKVIVSRTGLLGFPHIVGEDIIRIGLKNTLLMEYDVAEIASYDSNLFAVEAVGSGGNIAGAKMTGNMLEVEGKASGQALLRISCRPVCEFYKEVVVIVTTTPDGLLYLTTRDNFTQVKINETKVLAVEMVGLDNAGDQGYVWTVDSGHESYIDLDYTGKQAQVRGLEAGAGKTARIVISNSLVDPLFNLAVYVRVSNADINTTYITTQRNIVSVVEGRSVYLEAELVNGIAGEDNLFVWSSLNTNILSVEGAGGQVVVLGKQIGIGRVRVNHSSAVNSGMEILVIVEKDMTGTGIYITTDNTLIDIKPNDTKQLEVRLVGGNPEDVYGFIWNIASYESVVKVNNQSQQVVTLVSNANKAYLTGIRDGEATVRVTHPKTNYVLDIKVYVRLYSTIRFAQRSLTLEVGENKIIGVEAPAGVVITYTASQYKDPVTGVSRNIVSVQKGNEVCGIQGIAVGVCTVYAVASNGMSDELLVQVNPASRTVRYIQTPEIIYSMSAWNSSANRMMIAGATVGEKEYGYKFTEADDAGIVWEIKKTQDKSIIGFDSVGSAAGQTSARSTGKTVMIYTQNKPTEAAAEITLTHPEMPGYAKTLYVNVYPHDPNFFISPVFLDMQLGDIKQVTADINNTLEEADYSLVSWSVTKNEKDEDGIRIKDYQDEKTHKKKIANIEAFKEGVYYVNASYKTSAPLTATVYVEKRKTFEILGESYITLLPGERRYIGLKVEPGDDITIKNISIWTDLNRYLSIEGADNEKIRPVSALTAAMKAQNDYIRSKMSSEANAFMIIKGLDREGNTQIKMTSNNIERLMTVNTNKNYTFYMKGIIEGGKLRPADSIRGKPGDTVVIEYGIFPENDNVALRSGSATVTDNNQNYPLISIADEGIDRFNNRITIKLDNCGYKELVFESDYNKAGGIVMKIPTYVYYNNIPLEWVESNKPATNKSRLDAATNAVYIANNEELNVTFAQTSGQPAGYPGANVIFESSSGRFPFKDNEVTYDLNSDSSGNRYVNFQNNYPKITGNESLLSVQWVGNAQVKYSYYTGGKTRTEFTKTFMVYAEVWATK